MNKAQIILSASVKSPEEAKELLKNLEVLENKYTIVPSIVIQPLVDFE